MSRLFIVDDDVLTCELLKTITQSYFETIFVYYSGQEFLQQTYQQEDIVILDLMMPEFDGIEVIRYLAVNNCRLKFILISGYDRSILHSAEQLAQDYGLNVVGSFTKPISTTKLLQLLKSLIKSLVSPAVSPHVERPSTKQSNNNLILFSPQYKDIIAAIEKQEFILHYQPQVSIVTNKLIGVEALVRWQHPKHGLIYPDKFISIAEQSDAIDLLTQQILIMAIKQSAQWQKQNLVIKISINLSAKNIINLELPEQLSEIVKKYQLDPSRLILEVTESALMNSLTTALDILTRLRLKGFQLSIDDFGTGFSSLSQLHKIPFTELKIDQSFVNNMLEDTDCLAIVETCIMLAHKLDMEVVAEGIENEKTLSLLTAMHCDIAQGYFFAKPMPANEIIFWREKSILNLT